MGLCDHAMNVFTVPCPLDALTRILEKTFNVTAVHILTNKLDKSNNTVLHIYSQQHLSTILPGIQFKSQPYEHYKRMQQPSSLNQLQVNAAAAASDYRKSHQYSAKMHPPQKDMQANEKTSIKCRCTDFNERTFTKPTFKPLS